MPCERSRGDPVIEVVLVESPACHLCEDAADALEALADDALVIRRVDISSPEGRSIVRRYRAPMPPIITINSELLGWGRLSRGKLRRRLDELAAVRLGE